MINRDNSGKIWTSGHFSQDINHDKCLCIVNIETLQSVRLTCNRKTYAESAINNKFAEFFIYKVFVFRFRSFSTFLPLYSNSQLEFYTRNGLNGWNDSNFGSIDDAVANKTCHSDWKRFRRCVSSWHYSMRAHLGRRLRETFRGNPSSSSPFVRNGSRVSSEIFRFSEESQEIHSSDTI